MRTRRDLAPKVVAATEQGQRRADNGPPSDREAATPQLPLGMLNTLFMHLPSGVIVVDAAGSVVFMNEAGERLSREIQLTAGTVAAVPAGRPGTSPPATHGTLIAEVLAGKTVRDTDYVLGIQGEARHQVVQIALTALRDDMGRITGAVLTLTDLTERVDGQATLARAAESQAAGDPRDPGPRGRYPGGEGRRPGAGQPRS